MENLKDIISEIQRYRKDLNLKDLTDNQILDTAGRIFNTQSIQDHKQEKSEESKVKKASQKQRDLLKKLKYNGNLDNLTVREAFELINKLLPKK